MRAQPLQSANEISRQSSWILAIVVPRITFWGCTLGHGALSLRATRSTTLERRSCTSAPSQRASVSGPDLLQRTCRADHLADLGDLGRWKAADLGMLANDRLVLGKIDAERLIGCDKAFDPLNVRCELGEGLVGFLGRAPELLSLQRADLWDVPFDDESAQCHGGLQFQV